MNETRAVTFKLIGVALFIVFFYLFIYTFIHESGHALVGLASGGTIDAFSVNFFDISAHVAISGTFTLAQTLAINLAGVSLPALIWLGFILAAPKRANLALEILKTVTSASILSTFLVWVVISFLYLAGQRPSDDSTSFLTNSGFPPLAVAGVFFLLAMAGAVLFRSRIEGARRLIERIRRVDNHEITPELSRTLIAMGAVFVICGCAAFWANGFKLTVPTRQYSINPPAGYQLFQTIDLSQAARTGEPILNITMNESRPAGIFLLIKNINTAYFEVRLTSPNQYNKSLIHAETYQANQDSVHFDEVIPSGPYQLILTSSQSPGTVSIYTR